MGYNLPLSEAGLLCNLFTHTSFKFILMECEEYDILFTESRHCLDLHYGPNCKNEKKKKKKPLQHGIIFF